MNDAYISFRGRPIQVRYWAKPIPTRSYDWEATEEGWDLGDPIGYGPTEAAAIDELQLLLESFEEERERYSRTVR